MSHSLATKVEVVLPSQPEGSSSPRFTLLEGALWSTDLQKLLFIDIEQPSVHTYDPKTNEHKRYPVSGKIGTVVTTTEPNIVLIASQSGADAGISQLDLTTGKETPYAPHPDWEAKDTRRFNDGKVAPDGVFHVGTMVLDEVKPRTAAAAFYTVKPAADGKRGTVEKVFDGVTISNGLCWTSDSKTMYYIDTPKQQIEQFDFSTSSGLDVKSRKTIVTTDGKKDGFPDGCTIDSEDKLWVAFWTGNHVSRYDPASGKEIHRINLPCSCITSLAFGGDDLQDLYITTANNKVDLQKEPTAGSLFVVKNVGVKGSKSPVYRLSSTTSRL